NDPVVRAATQQLLWLQSQYLAEHFPELYSLEKTDEFGWVVTNKTTDDQFSARPGRGELPPLAISGMLARKIYVSFSARKADGRRWSQDSSRHRRIGIYPI